jgi:hypothetical protein
MGVVKVIGERYLWVDSLCIVQDEDEMLRKELKRMHLIYEKSTLAIIAQAGEDAAHGLLGIKGVSEVRSTKQSFYKIAGERLAEQDEELPPLHATTGYRSRAWTLQECAFAKASSYIRG